MDTYPQSQSSTGTGTAEVQDGAQGLHVRVMSFGYKEGPPPLANMTFDVRFLKNPYWVPELRPLNGMKDKSVQDYVMNQAAATEFLDSVTTLVSNVLPHLPEIKLKDFSIAFGCTGGQHRSATMCEMLAKRLAERFPNCRIDREHRELSKPSISSVTVED